DETRSRDEPGGVDDTRVGTEVVDRDEAAVVDADVTSLARSARPIDHEPAGDQGVGHGDEQLLGAGTTERAEPTGDDATLKLASRWSYSALWYRPSRGVLARRREQHDAR